MSFQRSTQFCKTVLVCALAGLSLAAVAKEAPIGALSYVKGNVSVGGNGFVSKAARGTPLLEGSVVMVATGGQAIVKLDNGCALNLSAGQHITVNSKLSCYELQASVNQMFSPYQVAQSGGAVVGGGGAAGGAGLGVVGAMAGVSVVGFSAVKADEASSGS